MVESRKQVRPVTANLSKGKHEGVAVDYSYMRDDLTKNLPEDLR